MSFSWKNCFQFFRNWNNILLSNTWGMRWSLSMHLNQPSLRGIKFQRYVKVFRNRDLNSVICKALNLFSSFNFLIYFRPCLMSQKLVKFFNHFNTTSRSMKDSIVECKNTTTIQWSLFLLNIYFGHNVRIFFQNQIKIEFCDLFF